MSILVTGATGHVGVFTVIDYIKNGYIVNTTIRDLNKKDETLEMITKTGNLTEEEVSRIKIFEADLTKEEGWKEAIEGCNYVCHVAYPFLNGVPYETLEKAAVDGTMNLMKLAVQSGIKQFVFCSSLAAVGYNTSYPEGTVIDETFWSDINDPLLDGYMKSKVIVEKKMFEFIASLENKNGMTLTSICPNAILGPLPVDYTKLVGLPKMLDTFLKGASEETFDFYYGITDVRDLTEAFVKATGFKDAFNERFILVTEEQFNMAQTFDIIKKTFPEYSDKLPKIGSVFISARQVTSAKARKVLGYDPITPETSLLDTVKSVIASQK